MDFLSLTYPLLVLLAVLVYGLVHSLLASLRAKALARRWLGRASDRFYRLAFNIFATLSLSPVLALPVLLPDRLLYSIPFPWSLSALALQGLAGLALLIGVLQTGLWSFLGVRQFITGKEESSGQLVVSGLYRWVRHPLYTAGLIFIWFIPRMTANLLALNLGISLYLVMGALLEERKLKEEYGEAYSTYQQRTSMLIPIFRRK